MKKCIWLLVLVLGMSTTAWSACQATVGVSPSPPTCEDTVYANITICCGGVCTHKNTVVKRMGSLIYVDVYLECTSPCGCTTLQPLQEEILDEPYCGLYVAAVRVWCTYTYWPYCLFRRPFLCGMGSTHFTVCCPHCCCYPCCCWITPCCPAPAP
jgi:hypothetical protein